MADPFDNEAQHNRNLEEDTEFGLHPCTLTGEYDEDDDQFIEVIVGRVGTVMARVLHSFPFFGRINTEWLKKYSESLIGYVAFEKGKPEKALLIAVAFKEGKMHDLEDSPRSTAILTEFYKLQFNDKEKKGYLGFPDDAKFYLGKLGASEPMVKGEKQKTSLEEIMAAVSDLAQQVSDMALSLSTTQVPQTPTGSSPLSTAASFAAQIPNINKVATDLATIKSKLGENLSEKNFLE